VQHCDLTIRNTNGIGMRWESYAGYI